MIRLDFICEFQSDIVLHASSNTEGKIEKLDYIPGSNFLGMVARYYGDFKKDAFEVFHSGAVRFGDGHIIEEGERTLAMPFAFQAYKGVSFEDAQKSPEVFKKAGLFVHHHLTQNDYDIATDKETQLKQQRSGYFTPSGKLAKLEHGYRQKSAYDKHKRRSKDSQMFGYHALPAGTKWAFSVTLDSDTHQEKIIKYLEGKKRLGKSKSAEYGLVEITFKDEEVITQPEIKPQEIGESKYLYIYAKSRLALTDDYGINSYTPSIESLGFQQGDNVKIDWDKSQIRTSRYTPYVGARRNFDPERLVIDKGSVFVIKITGEYDAVAFAKRMQTPIGLYLSEGHGEVIVNPEWLLKKEVVLDDTSPDSSNQEYTPNYNSDLNKWLGNQRKTSQKEADLLIRVTNFIKNNKNDIMGKKAQWGQIRSRCRQAKDSAEIYSLLFSMDEVNGHPKGFLRHGRGLEKWSGDLIQNLEKEKNKQGDDYKRFVTLLSIYAPKEDDNEGGSHE
jgi:hypothetical protein